MEKLEIVETRIFLSYLVMDWTLSNFATPPFCLFCYNFRIVWSKMTQIKTLFYKRSKTTNNSTEAVELNSKKIQVSNYKYKVLMVYSCKLYSLDNYVHRRIDYFLSRKIKGLEFALAVLQIEDT